ncbi:unnamed protein product [Peniophora sp. CBMAI 1063]|nr:unnamed protein product [Peniophora sp. CBMAI 1063]
MSILNQAKTDDTMLEHLPYATGLVPTFLARNQKDKNFRRLRPNEWRDVLLTQPWQRQLRAAQLFVAAKASRKRWQAIEFEEWELSYFHMYGQRLLYGEDRTRAAEKDPLELGVTLLYGVERSKESDPYSIGFLLGLLPCGCVPLARPLAGDV